MVSETLNQALTKDISEISCAPTLTLSVTLDKYIIGPEKFNLIAAINHLGNFAMGHYTSFKKSTSSSWFHCNDSVVLPSRKKAAQNSGKSYFFL